ncbi:hypothetical protein [Halanaerobium salsuginis]|uniref:Uncharacterized protein n=1 Tax=Halanaerobium salsuginis TaxID=29563 RepID=A0A1I4L8N2_9FIRM|nr:hypothetical protein [Halanaerobium salsuginis]SFL87354.1 hypothetical protein SAMN02983006_02255 [Halanaerobium salsuginis]
MYKSKLVFLLVLLSLAVLAQPVLAHTPILYVEDYHDGTIYVQGGFSDGSSASGTDIYLLENKEFTGDTAARDQYLAMIGEEVPAGDPATFEEKLVIYKTQLDDFSEAIIAKPAADYQVVFYAGPGHEVVEDGPVLTDSEK